MAKVGSSLVELIVEGGEEVAPAAAATAPTTPAAPSSAPTPTPTATSTTTISEAGERAMTFATPAVRRVAKENNVDLSKVKGTGKDARILKEDVLNYVAVSKGLAPITTPSAASSSSSSSAPAPAPTVTAADSLVNLSPIQKSMFKTMTKSLQIPHFGYSEEINMNNASTFRAKVNQLLASSAQPGQYGSLKKITYMPILIKAYSVALSKFPILNAQVTNNTSGNVNDVKLLMRANHNIGVAMDTPQGWVLISRFTYVQFRTRTNLTNPILKQSHRPQHQIRANQIHPRNRPRPRTSQTTRFPKRHPTTRPNRRYRISLQYRRYRRNNTFPRHCFH